MGIVLGVVLLKDTEGERNPYEQVSLWGRRLQITLSYPRQEFELMSTQSALARQLSHSLREVMAVAPFLC